MSIPAPLPLPISLGGLPLPDAVTDRLGDLRDAVFERVLPDGPAADGVRLLAKHPGAALAFGRSAAEFATEHPDTAKGVYRLAKAARERPVATSIDAGLTLAIANPTATKELVGRVVDFAVDHDDAVRDVLRTYLGGS